MNDPAWMVRSGERQKLLESLKKMTREHAEKRGRRMDFDLSRICLTYIEHHGETHVPHNVSTDAWKFFYETIMLAVEEFARAHEERDAMICDFYEWLTQSVTREYHAALTRKEIAHPRIIFHASSGAQEI